MMETRAARVQRLFALCAHLSSGLLIAHSQRDSLILIIWSLVKEDNFSRKGLGKKGAMQLQSHKNTTVFLAPLVKQTKKKTRGLFADKQQCARDVDGAPSPLKLGVGAAAEARAGRQQAAGGRRAGEREAAQPQ